MKKLISFLAVTLSVLLVLSGCSSKMKKEEQSNGKTDLKIGVVVGEGGAKDKSFNQANVEAVQEWASKNKATAHSPVENKTPADVAPNLKNVAKVSDVVSIAGYDFKEDLPNVAKEYPKVKFIYIDDVVEGDNVMSVTFKEQEAGYLAGYASALQSKTGKIGFIGGLKIPAVARFGIGFVQGAKKANPDIEISYQYSGSFGDINKGKTLAATMFDIGIDVIFTAAGNTGNGAIKEAQERATKDLANGDEIKHFVVGVDKDQYTDGIFKAKDKSGKDVEKSVILTSAMKRVDVAVTEILNKIKDNAFKGNTTLTFGIKEKGLALPEKNPNLSKEISEKMMTIIKEIEEGKIVVVDDESKLKDEQKTKISGTL